MRVGRLPSQERVLETMVSDARKRTRRAFLLGCVAGIAAGGTASFVLSRSSGARDRAGPRAVAHRRLAYAHELARGPLGELREHYSVLLLVLHETEGDAELYGGLRRLADDALATGDEHGAKVADALLRAFDAAPQRFPRDLLGKRARLVERAARRGR